MTDESGKRRSDIGWGIPASILLHAVFAGILFFHLPLDFSEPQQEESVSVEIVPPPEEPQENAEEETPPEAPKPEEAEQEEQTPPEPPATEEAQKEEPPPPPPEPPKQEEAKEETPPPPPPPEPQEEAEQPEPPPPQQEEAKPEEQPSAEEQARGQPIPVLRPVFEFGEKDAGPRKSETGEASQDTATAPAESEADAEAADPPKPSEEEPVVSEEPPANPVPDDITVPEVDIAAADPQQSGAAEISPDAAETGIVTTPPEAAAEGEPSDMPPAGKPTELTEAKTLFSQNETGGLVATTAMGNVPRGVRAGQLCATELREQLRHASPSYRPEILPAYRLPSGTVLEVKRAAFRASAQWYDIGFRCEVDENATKVLSFAFDVGAAVPQSEWQKRGFPEF